MYSISPTAPKLAYTSNIDEFEATSTNNEIFIVPMAGGTPKKISTSPGNDSTPALFARWKIPRLEVNGAGRFRSGQESTPDSTDRRTGETRNLTEKFDRSVGSFTWAKFRWNPDEETWITVLHCRRSR